MEYSFTYYRLKFYIGWQCMTRGGKGYATANLRLCEQNVSSHETINFTWMFHNGKVKDRQGSVGVVTNEYSLPRIYLNGRCFPCQVKSKRAKGTRQRRYRCFTFMQKWYCSEYDCSEPWTWNNVNVVIHNLNCLPICNKSDRGWLFSSLYLAVFFWYLKVFPNIIDVFQMKYIRANKDFSSDTLCSISSVKHPLPRYSDTS